MDMQQVESSQIAAVGYDSESKVLRIRFKPKDETDAAPEYDYFDVPESVHADMMKSKSVGSFHYKHIRDVFRYQKLEQAA